MLASVRFMSRRQAESLSGAPACAVISITSPGQAPAALQPGFRQVLRVAFHDVTPGTPAGTPASAADIARIRTFVEALDADAGRVDLVVHCEAGVSRSAAVAFWVAQRYRLRLEGVVAGANRRMLDLFQPGLSQQLPPPRISPGGILF